MLNDNMDKNIEALLNNSNTYNERYTEPKVRSYIDTKERAERVYGKLLDGEMIVPEERLLLLYNFRLNSDLINKCTNRHVMNGTVYVKGINEEGKYVTVRKESLTTNNNPRVLLEEVPRAEVLEYGEDCVSVLIEGDAREKIANELIKALDKAELTVEATNNKKDDLIKAIDKLGKKHKNFTIVLNTKDYISLSNSINDLSKFDIVIDDNITNMYVGNLKTVVINYVLGKVDFDLNAKGGCYDIGCTIYNLVGCIADETGMCKIV